MSRRHSWQELTLRVHKKPVRKEGWTKAQPRVRGSREHIPLVLGPTRPIGSSAWYNYLPSFTSGTPPILVQTVSNKVLVQISISAAPRSKEALEESIYLLLDLFPKNHGFLGHSSFSHEIEKEMILKTLLM